MSMKTIYNCDHCGAECSGDEYATIGRWEEPGLITFGKTVHGCSKEHLGLAFAKEFGIDGKAVELLNGKQGEIDELQRKLTGAQYDADSAREELSRLKHAQNITDPTKPTKPAAIDGHEAYIEARMQYQRVAGGTVEEMGRFWQENRERFCRDERLVMANGDIVRDMEFEE